MIISISGSQGQGKTTTAQGVISANPSLLPGATNVARIVLKDWNASLDDINTDRHLKMAFQDKISDVQHEIELGLSSSKTHISERSYADMFVYALVTLGSFNKCSSWLNKYYDKCYKFQSSYKKIFFLTGREYIPEDDGVRSINKYHGKMIETITYQYINEFTENNIDQEIININMPYTNDRVATILARLSST